MVGEVIRGWYVDVEGRKEGGKRNDRNRGRFAAIALPRSYRPEPPDSILLVPHIPMYMHTYLLFVRVHTYILRSHDSFSARFFTSSTSLFFPLLHPCPFLFFGFWYTTASGSVSLQPSAIDIQYTDFYAG